MTRWNSVNRRKHYEDARKAHQALMKFYPLSVEDLDGELWCDIGGYEGLYQISNYGRVKSTNRRKEHILRPCLASNGYLNFCLSKGGVHKPAYCARLVAIAFIPNIEDKPEVNHVDGHPMNNSVSNLEWSTQSENQKHAYKIGLQVAPQGAERHDSKLTVEQVLFIRENANRFTQRELAVRFGIRQSLVSRVQLGKGYKNVGGQKRTPINRLTDECRKEIRELYKPYSREFGTKALAKKFGFSASTIWYIVNGNR